MKFPPVAAGLFHADRIYDGSNSPPPKKKRKGALNESRATSSSASRLPATSWVHYTASCNTQSSASDDGRNYRPKHVELIGITNKPLLLHLVVYIIYINDARSSKHQIYRRIFERILE